MKNLIWLLVAVLLIAHQDFWNWNDYSLCMGFIPMGLFYHACLSIAAGVVWFMVCTFAWPDDLEEDFETEAKVGGTR